MKILAIALADDWRRFVRGFPPKGARLLLNPDLEIASLFTRAAEDQIIYQDEKVEVLDFSVSFDAALVSTDFWQESRIREVAFEAADRGRPVILFGPVATAKHEELSRVADSVVRGNLLNVWDELRADLIKGNLKKVYTAALTPTYAAPDLEAVTKPAFDPKFQFMRAISGCRCPGPVRPFCRQHMYHHDSLIRRDLKELTGEVIHLRHKHVYLLDEDVGQDRDFYREFFARVWQLKREWTVLAGDRLFDDVRYIRLLAKAGARVVFLNESWLNEARLRRALDNRGFARYLRNQVRLLHRQRLLVGCRISLFVEPGKDFDYENAYRAIEPLSIDFLQVRFFVKTSDNPPVYAPMFVPYQAGLTRDKPTWWKNRFYTMGSIVRRSVRRPVRVGFYSTLKYYYPRSFACRQNLLEGIVYPP